MIAAESGEALRRTGRHVVVTGAAGAVGRVLVDRFRANGDHVLATDLAGPALEALQADGGQDTGIAVVAADIATETGAAAIAAAVGDRVDVLVNCAGYFPVQRFGDMTPADWTRVLEVNLTGVFLVTRAVLPHLVGRGWGRIINIGSASVFEGVASQAHYVAAKAGVVGLTRSLARDLGPHGITVNVVTPGLTVTPAIRDAFPPAVLEAQRQRRAIPRDEVPEDLAGPVLFLASPDADFITGQTLNVDGGKFFV